MIRPDPWVEVDGTRVYCQGDHTDDTVTILTGLEIDWGATDPLSDRQPAVATFRLWDPFGYWLARAKTQSVIGSTVKVGWTLDTDTRIIFQGRLSNTDIERSTHPRDDNTSALGWLVSMTATDKPADMGNVTFGSGTSWPAETALARANRLKQAATDGGIGITEFYFEPDAVNWPMGKTDTSDKSLLSMTDEFYRSFGLGWDYRPDENVIRPRQPANMWMSYLYRVPGTQDRVLVSSYFTTSGFGDDNATYYNTAILGCDVTTADRVMALDRSSSVNRIEVEYTQAAGTKFRTTGQRPASVYRSAQLTTWLNFDSPNQGNASRTFTHTWQVIDQSAMPSHPVIVWDTRYTGDGFHAVEQAFALTRCAHTPAIVRVHTDPYADALGLVGDLQIVGGRVEYLDHRWIVTLNPAWTHDRFMAATSWADFRANGDAATLTWNAPSARLHHSVAWSDLRNIMNSQPTPSPEMS